MIKFLKKSIEKMEDFDQDLLRALEQSLFETHQYSETNYYVDMIGGIFLNNLSFEHTFLCERYFYAIIEKLDEMIKRHKMYLGTHYPDDFDDLRQMVNDWLLYMVAEQTHLDVEFWRLSKKVNEFEKLTKLNIFE